MGAPIYLSKTFHNQQLSGHTVWRWRMDRSRQTSLTAATAIMAGGLVEVAAFIPFTIAHGPTSYNLGNEVLVGHASVGVHHGLHPPVAGGHGPLAAPRPGSGGTSHCDRGSLRHVRHDVPVRGHDRSLGSPWVLRSICLSLPRPVSWRRARRPAAEPFEDCSRAWPPCMSCPSLSYGCQWKPRTASGASASSG